MKDMLTLVVKEVLTLQGKKMFLPFMEWGKKEKQNFKKSLQYQQ